ncbi:hypothetical protein GS4_14_01510 [Gordonia soli NBRC 108243]|uniref:Uncharacterized protein n=1 Tax=Gordonia soli NBRC 108243 TaxID=1223545 RepID=M0QIE2_9ACTN|nr:hypothetical protein GS4_14_01510 [Gordonia soli NBRC 108243]
MFGGSAGRASRGPLGVGMIVTVLLIGGCSMDDQSTFFSDGSAVSQERVDEMNAELRALPSLEATGAEFGAVIREIASAVERVAPGTRFPAEPEGTKNGICTDEWASSDGRRVFLGYLTSPVPIPEDRWDAALAVARELAADHGLVHETVRRDLPNDHDVVFSGGGHRVSIGSLKAAVISGVTACRLPERTGAGSPTSTAP